VVWDILLCALKRVLMSQHKMAMAIFVWMENICTLIIKSDVVLLEL